MKFLTYELWSRAVEIEAPSREDALREHVPSLPVDGGDGWRLMHWNVVPADTPKPPAFSVASINDVAQRPPEPAA